MARLQISHDSISFVPGSRLRRYFEQPVIEAAITPQSTEILLCQHGLPNGYRVPGSSQSTFANRVTPSEAPEPYVPLFASVPDLRVPFSRKNPFVHPR
jgi:hypothetical protein